MKENMSSSEDEAGAGATGVAAAATTGADETGAGAALLPASPKLRSTNWPVLEGAGAATFPHETGVT